MQRRSFLLSFSAATALAGCASDDDQSRENKLPPIYMPPDPSKTSVGYIENWRNTGVLGVVSVWLIDGLRVIDPRYQRNKALTERYATATKTVAWSDGTETRFLAVPVGARTFGVYYAPGMRWHDLDPFSPQVFAYLPKIHSRVERDGHYRTIAANGPGGIMRIWLEDIMTGEVIGSASIK